MKESIWGWAIVVVGIVAIFFVYFFQNITNTDEHNYNLLKDVTESAMLDAIDLASYTTNDVIFMDGDKFVENFVRRFAESATLSRTYVIKIYDVSELPPKVSLQVSSVENGNVVGEIMEFDITNRLDAILESVTSNAIVLPTTQQSEKKQEVINNYIDKVYKNNPVTSPTYNVTDKYVDKYSNILDQQLKNSGICTNKTGDELTKCLQEYKNKSPYCSSFGEGTAQYKVCVANSSAFALTCESKKKTSSTNGVNSSDSDGIVAYSNCIKDETMKKYDALNKACEKYKDTTKYDAKEYNTCMGIN